MQVIPTAFCQTGFRWFIFIARSFTRLSILYGSRLCHLRKTVYLAAFVAQEQFCSVAKFYTHENTYFTENVLQLSSSHIDAIIFLLHAVVLSSIGRKITTKQMKIWPKQIVYCADFDTASHLFAKRVRVTAGRSGPSGAPNVFSSLYNKHTCTRRNDAVIGI